MVRNYHGTIEGIFWRCQSSYDASNFKYDNYIPKNYWVYYGCNCFVENVNLKFCHNCYKNYEEQYNNLSDDEKIDVSKGLLAFENNNIKYEFNNDEIDYIENKLKELEYKIGVNNINKLNYQISNEYGYNYEFDNSELENIDDDEKLKLIALWCFGKQILYAINKNDYCLIICEL
jgi:hypothetical protein